MTESSSSWTCEKERLLLLLDKELLLEAKLVCMGKDCACERAAKLNESDVA